MTAATSHIEGAQVPQQPAVEPDGAATPWTHTVRRIVLHMLVVAVLIGCTLGGSRWLRHTAQDYAAQWRTFLIPQTPALLEFPTQTSISASEQARLVQQHTAIQQRERLHAAIMEFYYTRFYMGIITVSVTGAVAAILLVVVSKRGWNHTNQYLITTFFVASAATVFYGSLPGVFRQDQTITDNKALLLKYLALENEVQSYVTTNEALNYTVTPQEILQRVAAQVSVVPPAASAAPPPTSEPQPVPLVGLPLSASDFIHYVDLQLAQDNIAIGFDYQQVPTYQGVFDAP